jgi:hypothetical protein
MYVHFVNKKLNEHSDKIVDGAKIKGNFLSVRSVNGMQIMVVSLHLFLLLGC